MKKTTKKSSKKTAVKKTSLKPLSKIAVRSIVKRVKATVAKNRNITRKITRKFTLKGRTEVMPPKINVKVILDRSGSMQTCAPEVINGFNQYIAKLREDKKTEYTVHLVRFDTEIETVYKDCPLKAVPDLNEQTFVPRGMTALNDAIGKTITESGDVPKDTSVLLVVFTDGAENASKEFTVERVRELIKAREANGNWTVTYIGQDLNSQRHATAYGISANNFLQAGAGAKGVRSAYVTLASSTVSYSDKVSNAGGQAVMDCNFFAPEPPTDEDKNAPKQ